MTSADYFRPRDLGAALDLMRRPGMRPFAGATDLFPATQARELAGPVLDLTAIEGLRGVVREGGGWRFGATTTWTDIVRAALPPAFDGLKLAAREVGSIQIQNAGTVAGNLCNASPAADGTPCWLSLDAEVEIGSSDGLRRMAVRDFVTGPRRTALRPGELVTAIIVPGEAAAGNSTFLKLGGRRYLVISIAMVAARFDIANGVVRKAAMAVGSCGPIAARLAALEARLEGARTSEAVHLAKDDLIAPALSPIDDVRADAGYRLAAAGELVRRALAALVAPDMAAA